MHGLALLCCSCMAWLDTDMILSQRCSGMGTPHCHQPLTRTLRCRPARTDALHWRQPDGQARLHACTTSMRRAPQLKLTARGPIEVCGHRAAVPSPPAPQVQDSDSRLSKWTLSTHQFGRDWEFSWLARNLAPIKYNKLHWVSERGSASLPGVEISNRGQIKFARTSPSSCAITLIIS